MELLEKFRSVQERARRAQRQGVDGDGGPSFGVSELRIGDGTLDARGKDGRVGVADPIPPAKETAAATPPVPPKKSGLGRQFGRLGGAVAGRNRRG